MTFFGDRALGEKFLFNGIELTKTSSDWKNTDGKLVPNCVDKEGHTYCFGVNVFTRLT